MRLLVRGLFIEAPELSAAKVAIISTAGLHRPDRGSRRDFRLAHWSPNFDRTGFAEDVNVVRIEVPRFAGFAPVADADGDIAAMACFAGDSVGAIDAGRLAGEIVSGLASEAATILAAATAAVQR